MLRLVMIAFALLCAACAPLPEPAVLQEPCTATAASYRPRQ
jgi:hypothetical protein